MTLMPSAPPVTAFFGSPDVAGPLVTSPVAASNSLPWQAHLIVPFSTLLTVHPRWGHRAENAL